MANILLVDDQPELRELYSEILQDLGHAVTTASNGREALSRLEADWTLDIVLLDLEMPELGGLETTRAIRASLDPRIQGMSVVLLTSHELPDDVGAGLTSGADAYVIKPVDPTDLGEELQLLLASGDV